MLTCSFTSLTHTTRGIVPFNRYTRACTGNGLLIKNTQSFQRVVSLHPFYHCSTLHTLLYLEACWITTRSYKTLLFGPETYLLCNWR